MVRSLEAPRGVAQGGSPNRRPERLPETRFTYRDHPRRAIRLSRLCAVLTHSSRAHWPSRRPCPRQRRRRSSLADRSRPSPLRAPPLSNPAHHPSRARARVASVARVCAGNRDRGVVDRRRVDFGTSDIRRWPPGFFRLRRSITQGSYDAAAYVYSSEDGTYRIEGLLAGTYTRSARTETAPPMRAMPPRTGTTPTRRATVTTSQRRRIGQWQECPTRARWHHQRRVTLADGQPASGAGSTWIDWLRTRDIRVGERGVPLHRLAPSRLHALLQRVG